MLNKHCRSLPMLHSKPFAIAVSYTCVFVNVGIAGRTFVTRMHV